MAVSVPRRLPSRSWPTSGASSGCSADRHRPHLACRAGSPVADCPADRGGLTMVSKRLSREAGHRRKFLAIIDETPECERAVAYASRRAKSTGGSLVLLFVIEPGDFQHWLGVEKIMREEAAANAAS